MHKKGNNRKHKTPSSVRLLTLPTLAYVTTGQSASISFQTFITGCEQTFKGLPWRLRSCKCEVVVQTTTTSNGLTPAVVQISLCDAKSTNVEAITSCRFLALSTHKTVRHLKMKQPNPWKEDEEASQAVIVIDNLDTEAKMTTSIMVYLTATFQLGPMRFTPSKTPLKTSHSVPSDQVWGARTTHLSPASSSDLRPPSSASSLEQLVYTGDRPPE
jgi:hypothetical protein